MSELRWILIGFGIVLLAGIYLWGRRGNAGSAASQGAGGHLRTEPPLQEHEPADFPDAGTGKMTGGMSDDDRVSLQPGDPVVGAGGSGSFASLSSHGNLGARGRVEPTFSDATPTEDLPAREDAPVTAPTVSSSEAPPARRIERRKILSVRLSVVPQSVDGARLLQALQSESLEHGKYQVFHRLHDDGASIFSVASMVEPGTFDLQQMPQTEYPGVTLFAQLPGPVPGMHALNELIASARRLQQSLGGTLQDDRGVPLTVHRIERLRQEVREFERPALADGRGSSPSHSVGA